MVTSRERQRSTLSSAASRMQPGRTEYGLPIEFEMSLIDEDPHQPRTEDNPGFSAPSLQELAATIRLRGVKTPISLRQSPDVPGRYVINHGHRRFRASKIAGKTTIPAFIDNDYNDADQVIENLQRNQLTPREIADYIGRELAKGLKKGEIAKSIGKSAAFVTQHVTLLDLPGPIAIAFNIGRVRDVTLVSELVTCFKTRPAEVTAWLADQTQDVTRTSVKRLRDFLEVKNSEDNRTAWSLESSATDDGANQEAENINTSQSAGVRDRRKSSAVRVRHGKRYAHLVLQRRPSIDGHAWLQYEGSGEEVEVDLSKVRLVSLVDK